MSADDQDAPESYAAGFWEAAAKGTLAMQHCSACGELQLYPRRRCVACGGDELDYVPASGDGTVYTYSTIFRNPPSDFVDELPYTLAIVRLEEGPQLLTRIVDCDHESLRCDLPVRCRFVERGGRPLPCFAPTGTTP